MKNTIVVIGCGRLGSSIANYASRSGHDVIVIDSDESSFDRLDDVFAGLSQVADATDVDALVDFGVSQAKEVSSPPATTTSTSSLPISARRNS